MFSFKVRVRHRAYSLGPLEWQVMGILWHSKECSVQDVVARLRQCRRYTTIMTTMNRLFQKGLLSRTLSDRKFIYTACITRSDLEKAYVGNLVSHLLTIQTNSRAPELILLQILESLSRHDAKLFRNAMAAMRTKPRPRPERARSVAAGK